MRLMGIDYGGKNIGLAVSDEGRMLARSIGTVRKENWEKEIPELVGRYRVSLVVVGMPSRMDSTPGAGAARVGEFTRKLASLAGCEVVTWDERLTSRLAERYLLESDMSRKKRKKTIDGLAAQIILQDYLDYLRRDEEYQPEAEEI